MKLKDQVEKLLREKPALKDDDMSLIGSVWFAHHKDQFQETDGEWFMSVKNFKDFTKPESIRRMRQKLQEDNPELRGKNYKKRQKLEEVVRENINNPDIQDIPYSGCTECHVTPCLCRQ